MFDPSVLGGDFMRKIMGLGAPPNNESAIHPGGLAGVFGNMGGPPAAGANTMPAAPGSDMGPGGGNVPMPPQRPMPGQDLQTAAAPGPGLWNGMSQDPKARAAGAQQIMATLAGPKPQAPPPMQPMPPIQGAGPMQLQAPLAAMMG